MRRLFGWVFSAVVAVAGATSDVAMAGPDGIAITGEEVDHSIVTPSVTYEVASEGSQIVREDVGAPGTTPLSGIPIRNDLDAKRVRHTITPRIEVAILPRLWMTAALPVVIADRRSLSLHDGVDRTGSSTIIDGLLPASGYDAEDPTQGFAEAEDLVFRGRSRRGLDQIQLGVALAAMEQRRDATKPTWKIGAEIGLAIGKVARFDYVDPSSNQAIGRGVHDLRLWTTISKRYAFVKPSIELSWRAPIAIKDASLFRDLGYGSTNGGPQQQAELRFALEATAIDRPRDATRLGIEVGSRVSARFEGRDTSELWEVFAFAGDTRNTGAPLILDADPTTAGVQELSHPGLSNVENYLELAGHLAVRTDLGRRFHLSALAEVVWKTDHTITFADAGTDLPSCSSGRTSGCEAMNNEVIDAGTEEENPAFVSRIDLVGHRYRSIDALGVILGVQFGVSF
jgi:hypothetical protein